MASSNPWGSNPWKGNTALGPLYGSFSSAKAPGLLTPGNIDIYHRPVAHNSDGSISTVRSITLSMDDGKALLLPTVSPSGKVLSIPQAVALWRQTGQHLGIFRNEKLADRYAVNLHDQQASEYLPK